MKAILIMGSGSDYEWGKQIVDVLNELGIESVVRVASAHKTPLKVLEIIREYEKGDVVFITVAGRSNALGGFVDAHTVKPVISCPPYSDKFSGSDIFSSLRMPSGVAPLVVLDAENAALAAAKMLGMCSEAVLDKVREYQERKRLDVERADVDLVGMTSG